MGPSARGERHHFRGFGNIVARHLGISWTAAAIVWKAREGEEYVSMGIKDGTVDLTSIQIKKRTGDFTTCAGSIWFNLGVFCVNAFFALQHLYQRRRKWGGELGGPKSFAPLAQYFSAALLVGQWFLYIGAS